MIAALQTWLFRLRCPHQYRYSRSRPGALVCKLCRKRKGPPR